MWSQWEEDRAWSDSLLSTIETSSIKMHKEGNSEERISEKLSVYQVIFMNKCVLSDRRRIIEMYQKSSRLEDRAHFAMFRSAHLENILARSR